MFFNGNNGNIESAYHSLSKQKNPQINEQILFDIKGLLPKKFINVEKFY